MITRAAMFVAALAVAGACSESGASSEEDYAPSTSERTAVKSDDAPPEKKAALEFTANEKGFAIESLRAHGEVYVRDRTYQVTLYDFPEGTHWTGGGKKGRIESDIYDIIELADVSDQIGEMPSDKLSSAMVDPGITLGLILHDGRHADIKLPPYGVYGIEEALKKVENGPVLFGAEPPDDNEHDTIVLAHYHDYKVFGRATPLNQIDAIALIETLPEVKGTRICGGYSDNAGNAMADLELQFLETEVTVYDRRTGDVRKRKVFGPDKSCPMFTFREPGNNTDTSSTPTDKIESWLRRQVKRR